MIDSIQSLAQRFFEMLNITIESIEVTSSEADIYSIDLKTPDSAFIIGIHGQNLQPLSHILSRMIESTSKTHTIIHVEVNDYMKEKDARFFKYLDSRIELVMKTGKDIIISDLNSYERKKAHNYICAKNITGLRTYSDGEGLKRMLHIASDGIVSARIPREKVKTTYIEEDGVGI